MVTNAWPTNRGTTTASAGKAHREMEARPFWHWQLGSLASSFCSDRTDDQRTLIKGFAEAGIECQLNGVCKDISGSTPESTVCSNCYSCTYKNCCNKVYTVPLSKCTIDGWRRKGYKGNVPVDIGVPPKKRDAGCSKSNPCQNGYKCVAYKKGDDHGFCWRGPQGDGGASNFALAILIAGMVILL
ncbi:hypothetical protein niasHT_006552 [Heterodera trifolii]|uniref:Uncharacterized protein n=1 Tax=Heterodera trifolii TaxID=157864 RepID=A0ABD2LVT5_9BILA